MKYLSYGIGEIPFCDTEFEVDGLKMMWGGEAHVDTDGSIIAISREWLGEGPDRIDYIVPSVHAKLDTLPKKAARALATILEKSCKAEIDDALNDWHVSRLEREWEAA